jgi:hypothetical protein
MLGILLMAGVLLAGATEGELSTVHDVSSTVITLEGHRPSPRDPVTIDMLADAGMRAGAVPTMPNCQGHRQEALVGFAPLTTYLAVVTTECTPERCGPTAAGQVTLTPITDITMYLTPMTTLYGTGNGTWSVPPHD